MLDAEYVLDGFDEVTVDLVAGGTGEQLAELRVPLGQGPGAGHQLLLTLRALGSV